jgi:hypothetical protein
MGFFAALWRIVVGLVVRPWRLVWLLLVAAGTAWLSMRVPQDGLLGIASATWVQALGIVVGLPAVRAAKNDERHRARDGGDRR